MKQHINYEQLCDHLEMEFDANKGIIKYPNEDKQEKLNEMLGIKSKRNLPLCELFTIGKMIEILQSKYDECAMQIDLVVRSEWADTSDWHVVTGDDTTFIKEELCDALWEAVKYVLESEGKSD